MSKLITRIVAALLVPCLTIDYGLASLMNPVSPSYASMLAKTEMFSSQAFASRATEHLRLITGFEPKIEVVELEQHWEGHRRSLLKILLAPLVAASIWGQQELNPAIQSVIDAGVKMAIAFMPGLGEILKDSRIAVAWSIDRVIPGVKADSKVTTALALDQSGKRKILFTIHLKPFLLGDFTQLIAAVFHEFGHIMEDFARVDVYLKGVNPPLDVDKEEEAAYRRELEALTRVKQYMESHGKREPVWGDLTRPGGVMDKERKLWEEYQSRLQKRTPPKQEPKKSPPNIKLLLPAAAMLPDDPRSPRFQENNGPDSLPASPATGSDRVGEFSWLSMVLPQEIRELNATNQSGNRVDAAVMGKAKADWILSGVPPSQREALLGPLFSDYEQTLRLYWDTFNEITVSAENIFREWSRGPLECARLGRLFQEQQEEFWSRMTVLKMTLRRLAVLVADEDQYVNLSLMDFSDESLCMPMSLSIGLGAARAGFTAKRRYLTMGKPVHAFHFFTALWQSGWVAIDLAAQQFFGGDPKIHVLPMEEYDPQIRGAMERYVDWSSTPGFRAAWKKGRTRFHEARQELLAMAHPSHEAKPAAATVDPNAWRTADDIRRVSTLISPKAAERLLACRNGLPGGRFESLAQMESLARAIKGIGPSVWSEIRGAISKAPPDWVQPNQMSVRKKPFDWSPLYSAGKASVAGRYPEELMQRLRSFFRSLKEVNPFAKILDVGSGGLFASLVAREESPVFDLHGIDPADIDPERIPGAAGIHVDHVAVENMSLEENSEDAAVSLYGLDYSRNLDEALSRILHALRPGGRATFILHHPEGSFVRGAAAGIQVYRRVQELDVFGKCRRSLENIEDDHLAEEFLQSIVMLGRISDPEALKILEGLTEIADSIGRGKIDRSQAIKLMTEKEALYHTKLELMRHIVNLPYLFSDGGRWRRIIESIGFVLEGDPELIISKGNIYGWHIVARKPYAPDSEIAGRIRRWTAAVPDNVEEWATLSEENIWTLFSFLTGYRTWVDLERDAGERGFKFLKGLMRMAGLDWEGPVARDALERPDGVLDLLRRSHPATLAALAHPGQFTFHFPLPEGTYYVLFARALQGLLPPIGLPVINVDPYTARPEKMVMDGIFPINWALEAVRDHLAPFVIHTGISKQAMVIEDPANTEAGGPLRAWSREALVAVNMIEFSLRPAAEHPDTTYHLELPEVARAISDSLLPALESSGLELLGLVTSSMFRRLSEKASPDYAHRIHAMLKDQIEALVAASKEHSTAGLANHLAQEAA